MHHPDPTDPSSLFPAQDIEGKLVVVLANLKSRNMAGIPSHGMVLYASDASHENVELLIAPEGAAAPGNASGLARGTGAIRRAHREPDEEEDLGEGGGRSAHHRRMRGAYKDLEMVTSAGPVTRLHRRRHRRINKQPRRVPPSRVATSRVCTLLSRRRMD